MSILNTGNELLISTPVTLALNPHIKVDKRNTVLEDKKVMSFLTELRNLKVLRDIVIYESKVGDLDNGNINALVEQNIARLPKQLDKLYGDPLGRHDVDKAFYDEGFIVSKNPEESSDDSLAMYVTQTHYFTF